MSEPLFVYGNWASYDELSDGIELTEALAMRQLDELLRLRRNGVRFDAYLMDAFWFAPDGAYREWRKPHWPDGPDRWLDACRANGILPGLWFTANTLMHLEPAASWRDSISEKGWGMCLFEGGFLADFADVLRYWYGRGVRLFKFDFADFEAVPAGREIPDARVRNVEAFRHALRVFRTAHPDAVLMAYNGFEEKECMDRTDRPVGKYVDPGWLEVFDSMYCGDPRPADVPCPSFWRAVDVYSDHMARLFESSEIPLDRIDNCGFMAGPTGTCYWRGKQAWKGMLLLSLARGGRIHVAYGDLSLFSDEDAGWWGAAQEAIMSSMGQQGTKSFGGVPGRAEPYGWHCGDLAVVVNPSMTCGVIDLPQGAWEVVTHDPGHAVAVRNGQVELGGGQLGLLTSQPDHPCVGVLSMDEEIGLTDFDQASETKIPIASSEATVLVDTPRPEEVGLVFQLFHEDGTVCRIYPSQSSLPPIKVHAVTGKVGSPSVPATPHPIWSGMSWAVASLTDNRLPCLVRITIPAVSPAPGYVQLTLLKRSSE